MGNPCDTCIVAACCSKRCEDYARYVFDSKNYEKAGSKVAKRISEMPYEEALTHILMVENVCQYLERVIK